jgi:hypothetical protein
MTIGHEHGSEYQLKFVLDNGEEDLTGWFTQDELMQAMAEAMATGRVFWLQERNIVCLACTDREQQIFEYPVGNTETSRCRPHDSRYLVAARLRNRAEVLPPR